MQINSDYKTSGSSQNNSKSDSTGLLTTDGGKTKSNATEVLFISLPTGGGDTNGIDEKLSINALNGTAFFSFPLPFSPARGASPSLSLSYHSGAGNNIFGLSPNISLPSIKKQEDENYLYNIYSFLAFYFWPEPAEHCSKRRLTF